MVLGCCIWWFEVVDNIYRSKQLWAGFWRTTFVGDYHSDNSMVQYRIMVVGNCELRRFIGRASRQRDVAEIVIRTRLMQVT